MCDYSLEAIKNRKAVVGDKLVTHNFRSATKGFLSQETLGADSGAGEVAVCVMPGTEISFAEPIKFSDYSMLCGYAVQVSEHKVAVFCQINQGEVHKHHDALETPDGKVILLHHLTCGQEASVLQLPAEPLVQHTDLPAMTEQSEPGKTIPVNLEYTD
jgi:hypothetical protein